jgi:hypothetical protein
MELTCHFPLNRTSFGNVSYGLLREIQKRGYELCYFPIGPLDLAVFNADENFQKWIGATYARGMVKHNRDNPSLKLWHLCAPDESGNPNGCYSSYGNKTTLLSFYELDSPTELELNVARNFDTVFSSSYTCEIFKERGVNTRVVPLFFDSHHFHVTDKKYYNDDRVAFMLAGKFENRKRHQKVIETWCKRFGNDQRYYLNLAVYNPFFPPELNLNLLQASMKGVHYWNVNPLAYIPSNTAYNDFINSNHIVIGASGGEGWSLPEFHAVALGKQAVILNAHAYKDWANQENAVLFEPSQQKISSVDGVFFKEGGNHNQGQIYDWDPDALVDGLEKAIKRFEENPINVAGLELQKKFTISNTLDKLLKSYA